MNKSDFKIGSKGLFFSHRLFVEDFTQRQSGTSQHMLTCRLRSRIKKKVRNHDGDKLTCRICKPAANQYIALLIAHTDRSDAISSAKRITGSKLIKRLLSGYLDYQKRFKVSFDIVKETSKIAKKIGERFQQNPLFLIKSKKKNKMAKSKLLSPSKHYLPKFG